MQFSPVLRVALLNTAIATISIVLLYFRAVPEPWDLLLVGIVLIACPVGGLWFAVSRVKQDKVQGVSRWQTALGVVLALAVFGYAVAVLSMHR